MTRQHTSSVGIALLVLVLLSLLTWPVWRWLWGEWWTNSYYSHGILILPVSAYLAWRRWRGETWQGDNRGLALSALGEGLFLFLAANKTTYLAAFAMIVTLAGLAWTFGGLKLLRHLAFPLLFLSLMIPLPIAERATLPLALWTGVCSNWLVHWLGLDVIIVGTAVTLPNADLVIGAQCSGVQSLISLLSVTALFAYAVRGPIWGRLALLAAAIPLAMLSNILRVSSLIGVARYMGTDAAFRFYHDYSGILFFMAALLLIVPLARLFQCKALRFEVL
jgi:exosortase